MRFHLFSSYIDWGFRSTIFALRISFHISILSCDVVNAHHIRILSAYAGANTAVLLRDLASTVFQIYAALVASRATRR